jgi:hypothetical protein
MVERRNRGGGVSGATCIEARAMHVSFLCPKCKRNISTTWRPKEAFVRCSCGAVLRRRATEFAFGWANFFLAIAFVPIWIIAAVANSMDASSIGGQLFKGFLIAFFTAWPAWIVGWIVGYVIGVRKGAA